MRHGQWVKFSRCQATIFLGMVGDKLARFVAPIEAIPWIQCHRTEDGKIVGIFQREGKDSLGQWQPEHIVVVRPDGTNVRILVPNEESTRVLTISPGDAANLEGITDQKEIPAPRLAANPTWVPRP